VEVFQSCALRLNTKSTYGSLQKTYVSLVEKVGANVTQPLSERQWAAVCALYSLKHKPTSLPVFVAAVAKLYEYMNWPLLPRGIFYEKVVKGIQNYFGHLMKSAPKTAITFDLLQQIGIGLNHNTFDGARDWCCYLFAFFGMLRVGEYTGGFLRIRDVSVFQHKVRLTIPFSKTMLQPVEIDLVKRNDEFDPVEAANNYLQLYPIHLRNTPNRAFFLIAPTPTSKPLEERVFTLRLRNLIRQILPHVDANKFAGHSFRRGGASALHLAGVEEADIKRQGRWKSQAVQLYYDSQYNEEIRLRPTLLLSQAPRSRFESCNPSNSVQLPDELESQLDM
jgi:hypothetical protein